MVRKAIQTQNSSARESDVVAMPRFAEETRTIPYAKPTEVEIQSFSIDAWLSEKQSESATSSSVGDIGSWLAEKASTLPSVAQTTQAAAWFEEKRNTLDLERKEEQHELEDQWKEVPVCLLAASRA